MVQNGTGLKFSIVASKSILNINCCLGISRQKREGGTIFGTKIHMTRSQKRNRKWKQKFERKSLFVNLRPTSWPWWDSWVL